MKRSYLSITKKKKKREKRIAVSKTDQFPKGTIYPIHHNHILPKFRDRDVVVVVVVVGTEIPRKQKIKSIQFRKTLNPVQIPNQET